MTGKRLRFLSAPIPEFSSSMKKDKSRSVAAAAQARPLLRGADRASAVHNIDMLVQYGAAVSRYTLLHGS